MFLINGELANVPNSGKAVKGSLMEDILNKKKQIEEEFEYPIVLKVKDKFKTTHETGEVEYPGSMFWNPVKTVISERGSDRLMYCESFTLDESKNPIPYPAKILFRKSMVIQKEEWQKAVYLLFYYNLLEDDVVEVVNPKKINQDKHNEYAGRTNVMGTIFSHDKYDLSEEGLRSVAIAYGIEAGERIPLNFVQNALFDNIETQYTKNKKAYDEFLKAAKLGVATEIRANVVRAEQLGTIHAFAEHSQTWAFTVEGGAIGSAITQYGNNATRYDELVDFYSKNDEKYQVLKSILGDNQISFKKEGESTEE